MGKGFNNYMCKKFFHPASRDNLKRVWMAEQKAVAYKKKQEELRLQYEKEQDLYNNKALLSSESKDKLSVNFLYEPPPGAKKEREKEDDEPEYKFEWQRRFNAPREDYCKDNQEIRDQPFGIQVRNVRCIKCHKWGHINTDKECPLYNQSISSIQGSSATDPMTLVQQMRDDGLALKRSALALQSHISIPSQAHNLISSDEEDDKVQEEEIEFLKSLSTKQKHKLLKKLERLEKSKGKKKDKKKKKKSKKAKDSDSSSSSSSDSSSESEVERSRKKKKKSKKNKKRDVSSSSSDEDTKHKHKKSKSSSERKHSSKIGDVAKVGKTTEDEVSSWLKEVRHEASNVARVNGSSKNSNENGKYKKNGYDASKSTRKRSSSSCSNDRSHKKRR